MTGRNTHARGEETLRRFAVARAVSRELDRAARFAIAAQDAQAAWRPAPSDHTQLLDLCSLHYVRKVYKNNTLRIHGRVIDIPKRPGSKYATYNGRQHGGDTFT